MKTQTAAKDAPEGTGKNDSVDRAAALTNADGTVKTESSDDAAAKDAPEGTGKVIEYCCIEACTFEGRRYKPGTTLYTANVVPPYFKPV